MNTTNPSVAQNRLPAVVPKVSPRSINRNQTRPTPAHDASTWLIPMAILSGAPSRSGLDHRGERQSVVLLVHSQRAEHLRIEAVTGSRREKRGARGRALESALRTRPPCCSTLFLTAERPTPRPAPRSEASSWVDRPSAKSRLRSEPGSYIVAQQPSRPGVLSRSSRWTSIPPAPSSATSMRISPAFDLGRDRRTVPVSGLPCRNAFLGRLDPVDHSVANQVAESLTGGLQKRLVDRRLATLNHQLDLLCPHAPTRRGSRRPKGAE